MKRAGYGGVKAAAIETSSSVNGQIMPPVMGAAAFLMVEYVGIPYSDIVKHAFIPAVISYIALFYIVHLEALKLGLAATARERDRTMGNRMTSWGLGLAGSAVVLGIIYYVAIGAQALFGAAAPVILSVLLGALYVYSVWVAARQPDLPTEIDVKNPVLPPTWPTVKAGLHFLIPVGVLIWCLMVEELSPGLSAFYGVITQVVLMVTQRPLIAFFRRQGGFARQFVIGLKEVVNGCDDGARNMIGIAVATGCAGIIVGAITLTGLGLRMTDFVEFVSQGNILAMLLFTAFVCLVLGMGVPTTANYILVATLMAPVIVELGAQSGLVIPLIAVHLFVFYYGIMGDITPPVGLATFAGAAIAKENPIDVGLQGSVYAFRTVVLPFIWIFNPALLLIDVHGWGEALLVAVDRDHRVARVRGGDDGLVPHQVPLVGGRAAADGDLRAVPPGLVRGSDRAGVHRCAGVEVLRGCRQPGSRATGSSSSSAASRSKARRRTRRSRVQLGPKTGSTGNAAGGCAQAALRCRHVRVGHGRDAAGDHRAVRQHRGQGAHRAGLRDRRRQGADRPHQRALVLHSRTADRRARLGDAGLAHAAAVAVGGGSVRDIRCD